MHHPINSDIELRLKQNKFKTGRKVLFWAARPKKLGEAHKIVSAKEAYNRGKGKNYKNHGCTRVEKNGLIVMKIASPQCYKEGGTIWAKHIHFVVEGDDGEWEKASFHTILAIPSHSDMMETKKLKSGGVYVTPEYVKRNWKNGEFYMVYALGKKHPSLTDIDKYKDYKHVTMDYKAKTIRIPKEIKKGTPLVVYCASETCTASRELIIKLAGRGYENLFYMDAGMVGFSNESYQLFTKDSTDSVRKSYRKVSKLI
jgi:rhodanese-related sulfurtransferase